jgi:membrane-associated phospholipid phosphatase
MSAMSTRTANPEQDSHPDSRGAAPTALTLAGTWVLVLGVVVGWGWLLTHALKGSVDPWDNDISRWFAGQRTGVLDTPADVGTLLGETIVGVSVAVLAAVAFSLWQRSWRPVLFYVLLEAGIGALYFVATHVVTRQRPPVKILDAGLVPDHSFPSGHVATAVVAYGGIVVLAWVYARSARHWATPLLLLPGFVLLARLYQGAHHLTDVLTALLFALAWLSAVTVLLFRPRVHAGRRGFRARVPGGSMA